MLNIFAAPFSAGRPMTPAQYVNAMFQHTTSLIRTDTPEELQVLQKIANNIKASHDYHLQQLKDQNEELVKDVREKTEENVKLRELVDNNTLRKHDELIEQVKIKDKEIELLKTRFNEATRELKSAVKEKIQERVRQETERISLELGNQYREMVSLKDRNDNSVAQKRHAELANKLIKKNDEIKKLRGEVSELNVYRDRYYSMLDNHENIDPAQDLATEMEKKELNDNIAQQQYHNYEVEIDGYQQKVETMDEKIKHAIEEKESMAIERNLLLADKHKLMAEKENLTAEKKLLKEENGRLTSEKEAVSAEKSLLATQFEIFKSDSWNKQQSLNDYIDRLMRKRQNDKARNF